MLENAQFFRYLKADTRCYPRVSDMFGQGLLHCKALNFLSDVDAREWMAPSAPLGWLSLLAPHGSGGASPSR